MAGLRLKTAERRNEGGITSACRTLVFSTVEGELVRPRNITKAWSCVVPVEGAQACGTARLQLIDRLTPGHEIARIRPPPRPQRRRSPCYGHLIGGADEAAAGEIEGILK